MSHACNRHLQVTMIRVATFFVQFQRNQFFYVFSTKASQKSCISRRPYCVQSVFAVRAIKDVCVLYIRMCIVLVTTLYYFIKIESRFIDENSRRQRSGVGRRESLFVC